MNEKGESPLHKACIDGNLKRVKLLIDQVSSLRSVTFFDIEPNVNMCLRLFLYNTFFSALMSGSVNTVRLKLLHSA